MRKLAIVVGAIVVLVAIATGLAWWSLRSGNAKAELERLLSEALAREVAIGVLEVDPRGHVTLREVDVAEPPGFEGPPLLHAARLDLDIALDTLLAGRIDGIMQASGVELRVVARGSTTNLHGMLPRRDGHAGKPIDVHLDLAITGAHVELVDEDRAETLELEGVDVRVLLDNREGDRHADAEVAIASLGLHGVGVRALTMTVHGDAERVTIEDLHGSIGHAGTLQGSGELSLAAARGWSFALTAAQVDLEGDVAQVIGALYPPLAASVDATAASGRAAARFTISGNGLHWQQIRPTLAGTGTLVLTDVSLPRDSLLLALAGLAGRQGGELALARVEVVLAVAADWITLTRVSTDGSSIAVPIRGRVSLGGELDLLVELMPLVRAFGGGVYAQAASYTTSIPVRVGGTLDHPELAPPRAEDLARGLLGGALRRALQPGK
jgi:AsmA-like C-terminal region